MKTKTVLVLARRAALLLLLSTLNSQFSTSFAQGSAFTYQGRLNEISGPANGSYDFTFQVFDAPSFGASQGGPVTNSAVSVTDGLLTVTVDFGVSPFSSGAPRWLEISVRTSGGGAFGFLTPRQALTATPYAITAGAVTGPINGGLITAGTVRGAQLAAGAVAAANIASNSITASQLAAGSVGASQLTAGAAAANLNAGGQSGVPSGGLVLSATENNAALLSAGYVRIPGTMAVADSWQPRTNGTTPSARFGHTTVWTGSEMVVWGGTSDGFSSFFNDGRRYNPAGNSWTAVTTNGAPSARYSHTAVWTGSEMIIWGGYNGDYPEDGGRYNPAGNSWTAMSTAGAPSARRDHTAVWTGSEMLVWGGQSDSFLVNDGGRYNPAGNSWTDLTDFLGVPPSGRAGHTALWTGSEMVVWGGRNYSSAVNDGGRYDPVSETWTAMTTNGAPSARDNCTALWTGSELIVWGGNQGNSMLQNGGRYTPAGDNWTAVNTTNTPSARRNHTAVWTGNEMIIWGGYIITDTFPPEYIYLNDGGRYNPVGDSWTAVNTNGAPSARYSHTAVWTGNEMVIWGGYNGGFGYLINDTFSYTLGRVLYLYQRP